MTETNKDPWKKAFFWVMGILLLCLIISIILSVYNENSYKIQLNNYQQNYEPKCSEGKYNACISNDRDYIEYLENETAFTCSLNKIPFCMEPNASWEQGN